MDALQRFLQENPKDSFSRYALALEYAKSDRNDEAVRELETVIRNDPDYVATYYQLGQIYQKLVLDDEAEKTYRTGIVVASRMGNLHAQGELAQALDSLLAGS